MNGDRIHAAQPVESLYSPAGEGFDHHLRVSVCPEAVAAPLQLRSKITEVVDLSTKRHCKTTRAVAYRLPGAPIPVLNGETSMNKDGIPVALDTEAVRPAMLEHVPNASRGSFLRLGDRPASQSHQTCNAAHLLLQPRLFSSLAIGAAR